ncbi:GMP/IMP nucleotidase [Idiomarina xiamenensis]|uniref:HAD superfamily hydrolase n=1 Tax=Idiomarina xiamenensis 10-D-4 TaxID=740709 RepID=K2K4K9_9GAMM|nr:GMP/IMP nucleotidase [Idiomarina xiamenensis]EKE81532.1 HAD superfamily hydrolase [Idiomarina xiamenensis 10-D-4]
MLDWQSIDTVLLDMDGTLLDLHYDNQFWNHYLPQHYARQHGLTPAQADARLREHFSAVAGSLNWYCLDYWQQQLQLPIKALSRDLQHLIKVRDDVPAFLTQLRHAKKQVILVTNAHPDSLALKLEHTDLADYCDQMWSTHPFGFSKESPQLWQALQQKTAFQPERTLFIDDNTSILRTAQQFGIAECIAVANPDSGMPAKAVVGFKSFSDYRELDYQKMAGA